MIEERMIVIRNLKTFSFNFDFSKDVDENMKLEIEFIIESNESFNEENRKRDWTIIVKI